MAYREVKIYRDGYHYAGIPYKSNPAAKKGFHCGGQIAYGYRSVDRKLHIEESEAEAVRFILDQYGHGVYVSKIIEELAEKGCLHNGTPFKPYCIYSILRNKNYIGIYEYKSEVFTDIYPQIITDEAFTRVRARIETNKTGSRSVKTVYLLRVKLDAPPSKQKATLLGGVLIKDFDALRQYSSPCRLSACTTRSAAGMRTFFLAFASKTRLSQA